MLILLLLFSLNLLFTKHFCLLSYINVVLNYKNRLTIKIEFQKWKTGRKLMTWFNKKSVLTREIQGSRGRRIVARNTCFLVDERNFLKIPTLTHSHWKRITVIMVLALGGQNAIQTHRQCECHELHLQWYIHIYLVWLKLTYLIWNDYCFCNLVWHEFGDESIHRIQPKMLGQFDTLLISMSMGSIGLPQGVAAGAFCYEFKVVVPILVMKLGQEFSSLSPLCRE